MNFSEESYNEMVGELFVRFPSFQKAGASAYKPGIANMEFMDQLLGHPHNAYKIIHVAGTNGKGSVSNMLASALASCGLRVGLYTSPHISDFRERMRLVCQPGPSSSHPELSEGSIVTYISKEYIFDFVTAWKDTFDHLDLSFFEITTAMALKWFAEEKADVVVLETGLGGRLDSTNIVTPVLSVITNIGLDHCDLLGDTLPEIAFEKAGIIKPRVPVVIGESHPETDEVFERKVLYTNLPDPYFMGNRQAIMSLLTFADKVNPTLWDVREDLLKDMDLQGDYQSYNLRTVLAALDVIKGTIYTADSDEDHLDSLRNAIADTAKRVEFHGRWEKLSDSPLIICDIGHNEHGLRHNFAQLKRWRDEGRCSHLVVVYGSVADKDVDSVIHLFPEEASYIFTQADSKRALPAEKIREKYMDSCNQAGINTSEAYCCGTVRDAVQKALEEVECILGQNPSARPLIYIGGSTYVVSEAVVLFDR